MESPQKTTAYSYAMSQRYDQNRFVSPSGQFFHMLEVQQLQKAIAPLTPHCLALEVGCGTGRFVEIMALNNHRVIGIDPSPHMISLARKRCEQFSGATLFEAEGSPLAFPSGKFDFTYTIRVLNQTSSEEYSLSVIREMIRVTKPGGRLLIEFCNKRRPRRRGETGVRLSIDQVIYAVESTISSPGISVSGILFLSETVLHKTPIRLLKVYQEVDRVMSRLMPGFAARCYVTVDLPQN